MRRSRKTRWRSASGSSGSALEEFRVGQDEDKVPMVGAVHHTKLALELVGQDDKVTRHCSYPHSRTGVCGDSVFSNKKLLGNATQNMFF